MGDLTDKELKNLKPRAKLYKVTDRDGMYAAVTPTGVISFRYQYRVSGRQEVLTIGRYSAEAARRSSRDPDALDYGMEVSLAEARALLVRARRQVERGESPSKAKVEKRTALAEAVMRCVGSSPAAGLSALRNRIANETDRLEPQIYDEDGDDEDAVDLEPGTAFDADPELLALMRRAEALAAEPDPKLAALVDALTPLIKKGANPVVFCRYLATAEHVRDGLRKAFPKLTIESVTGVLTPDERRDRVADMAPADDDKQGQRLLVATDCLSEGINLQQLFDAVVHYDLSWNPTRHQQREGRVDRFGQPAEVVRSIMMFSPDSAIDGAVLDVILRKAEEIRKATGVTVPLPDERGPVTDALMASMMLRRGVPRQMTLDLRLDDGTSAMEARWRDAEENEKRSRARFAQNAMKPQEVAPEWEKVRALLGSPADARIFVERAMARFGVPLEVRKTVLDADLEGYVKWADGKIAELKGTPPVPGDPNKPFH